MYYVNTELKNRLKDVPVALPVVVLRPAGRVQSHIGSTHIYPQGQLQ